MPVRRIALFAILIIAVAATASADTVRVIVDRALVWTQPGGVSIVMNQLLKGQTAEVVRRVGDWYEIVAPPGSGGGDRRTGFISASQVVLESGNPPTSQQPATRRTPAAPRASQATPSSLSPKKLRTLNVDGAFRANGENVTQSFTAFTTQFAEAGSIATNYGKRSGASFDVLLTQPLFWQIGVGAGVDYYVRGQDASIDARIPHPFFFNQLRTATFTTDALSAHEVALHIPAVWTPGAIGPFRITIFGGPSIFHVSQTVITDLVLNDQYPFDTVTITGVKTASRKGTLFGFNAGGDVAYYFTPTVGVGGVVRYSHARLKFDDDTGVTTDGNAGGLSIGAGLRFRF
ncbi:MAG TPA: hypothetical protein VF456_11795 [Vicinamibacterales bacterium]